MPIAIGDFKAKKGVEVDLWSHLFDVVRLTKNSEPKINDRLAEINKDFADHDVSLHASQATVFAARMDVWLKPIGGGKKRASDAIKEKWAAGDLTVPQIDAFWDAVQEAIDNPSGTSGPVAIEDYANEVLEVDLWGSPFELIKVTAITEPAIDEQLEQIKKDFEGKDLTAGIQVELFAARMDVRLKPVGGRRTKASTLVLKKWNADELELPEVAQFWNATMEAASRPS